MEHNHFVNNSASEFQEANRSPIYGYQQLPVLTLEEATEKIISLIPDVTDYVSTAKSKCNRNSTFLTRDESAAIYLYSMPISFFSLLNTVLRAEDRHILKPWFAFLKLFVTALEKLPSTKGTVWRGVSSDVCSIFADGDAHIWWSITSCSMDLTIVERYLGETGTVFAIDVIDGKDISAFSAFPLEQEIVLKPGTHVSARTFPLNFKSHLLIIHLKEEDKQSESQTKPRYLFELMKQTYKQNSRIECIMNPSKSFPIEQSYINLAIVETKEQQEKEKKLLNANHSNEVIGTYEEIYGTKTNIAVKNIFEKCKDQTKNILVLGRAGIGKTTFCRYVAYQWATGAIWRQYELVIFIRLRNLTESRYPPLAPSAKYSLIDLIKTEYFCDGLSEEYERLLKEDLNKSQVLWLLDGYDEIIQNIPKHLQYLLDQLLNKPHHILTSRPYLNTLSYNVQLEIIGFTDDNIEEYVEQFFDQIKDKIDNAPFESQKLLNFLKCSPRIWGIVHIPVNLELICSLWCDTDSSKTTTLTMTTAYDKIIEWLCRRHLTKQNTPSTQMTKEDVYTHLHKELAFLESLAFNGMESNSIILPPKLLRIASKEAACSLQHQLHLLNIGILKSSDNKPIGTCIEADKNHYFLHLSFQEHFAARYLITALNGIPDQKKKAIDFIKINKYNQRFELVFTFTSGLLIEYNDTQSINLFWDTLLQEPLDLIGLRHQYIVISCIEEAGCAKSIPQYRESIHLIIKWINYSLSAKHNYSDYHLLVALKKSPSLVNQPEILDALLKWYKPNDSRIKKTMYQFICDLPISSLYSTLIQLHLVALNDYDSEVTRAACRALGRMGEMAATDEVIHRLLILVDYRNARITTDVYNALEKMGEKAATNKVINKLMVLLGDGSAWVRIDAYNALEKMGGKVATNELINRLTILLGSTYEEIRSSACEALGKMGEKAATNEVIDRLLHLLDNANYEVRSSACDTFGKMGEKAATNKVINKLMVLLGDGSAWVRIDAYNTLEKMGEKIATNEVINRLMVLLTDMNDQVRSSACNALGKMGEKASNNDVINRLMVLLSDTNDGVKVSACSALEIMGGKAVTNEVVNKLMALLGNADYTVRIDAYNALEKMGEKIATNELINRLLTLLGDPDDEVRSSACDALGEMGEKAGTNETINELLVLLGDAKKGVKSSACNALGKMGEKAATNEVINRLTIILSDANDQVRSSACNALGKMGEKASNNDVINRLMVLLSDTNDGVRVSACDALGKMGKKVATNKVIRALLSVYVGSGGMMEFAQQSTISRILNLLPCMSALKADTVHKLSKYISGKNDWCMNEVSPEKFIRAFINTKIKFWLSIILKVFVRYGYAITVSEMTIAVHDNRGLVELTLPNRKIGKQLRKYFANWLDNSLKRCVSCGGNKGYKG